MAVASQLSDDEPELVRGKIVARPLKPAALLPENPPLITIEIVSPDDRLFDVHEKCEEYQAWGVGNIWVVATSSRRLCVYRESELRAQPEVGLTEFALHITSPSLIKDLP